MQMESAAYPTHLARLRQPRPRPAGATQRGSKRRREVTRPFRRQAQADHADLSTAGGSYRPGAAEPRMQQRSAKVAALQRAIASGSYHVSSSDIADKLIETSIGLTMQIEQALTEVLNEAIQALTTLDLNETQRAWKQRITPRPDRIEPCE